MMDWGVRCKFLVALALVISTPSAHGGVSKRRFLLYDCSPGTGFDFRRDVYIRMANLASFLGTKNDWTLVLPPWGRIGPTWEESGSEEIAIPWSVFFDIESLNVNVRVMEYGDYVAEQGEVIDEIWYLQSWVEGKNFRHWMYDVDEMPCVGTPAYKSDGEGRIRGWFWGREDEAYAKRMICISVTSKGQARTLGRELAGANVTATSIMVDRAEKLNHDDVRGKFFWDARRSMVFSTRLKTMANLFRENYLNSTDRKDRTMMHHKWHYFHRRNGHALGGPYIAAHLQRRGFTSPTPEDLPSLETAAQVLIELAVVHGVDKVFVASDGTKEEMETLQRLLPKMVRYETAEPEHLTDSAVAVINQIICAHSRYFIGTRESEFTARITEDREILGFSKNMTYNRLCGDAEETCEQLQRNPVVWEDDGELLGVS